MRRVGFLLETLEAGDRCDRRPRYVGLMFRTLMAVVMRVRADGIAGMGWSPAPARIGRSSRFTTTVSGQILLPGIAEPYRWDSRMRD